MGLATGALVALSALSTGATLSAQRKASKNQIEQGRIDQVASDSATRQAEQDAREEQSMDLTQIAREGLEAESTATAMQANTGVAGVSAERVQNNITFQNQLDVNQINKRGENTIIGIRNAGFQNSQQIQSSINTAEANKPSNTSIAVNSIIAGAGTGIRYV